MSETSRLVIEVDSSGFLKAEGSAKTFESLLNKVQGTATKTEKSVKGLGDNFAAFQLIINKLPGPLKSIASGMMGMVSPATAATGAIISVIESMGRLVSEGYSLYQEQEVQIARLGAVLESTGASAWITVGQLQEFDTALQTATGRSSNEIMQMQSVLLGFTSITGERFDRLTEDMINMADVMGGSLVGSANAFGKALDMPAEGLSALTRYGFKFTVEQKNMIKALEDAGRHAEAQAIILASMEQAFGDAAEKTREARGATIDYEIAVTNLKRAIGEGFKPAIDTVDCTP
jgi:phage-related minor tail protein